MFARVHGCALALAVLAAFLVVRSIHGDAPASSPPIDISPPNCPRFEGIVISPDDEQVAFNFGPASVRVAEIDGRNPRHFEFAVEPETPFDGDFYISAQPPVEWSPDSSKLLLNLLWLPSTFHRQYPGVTAALAIDVATGVVRKVDEYWQAGPSRPVWDRAEPREIVRIPKAEYRHWERTVGQDNIRHPESRFVIANGRIWMRVPDSDVAVLLQNTTAGQGIRVAPNLHLAVVGTQFHFYLATASRMAIRDLVVPQNRATMTLDIERVWWTHDSKSVLFVSRNREENDGETLWRVSVGGGGEP